MARAFVSQGLGEGMKLGTPAGDLERQARRLERKGYRTQAGALMGEAALLRAENRGFSSSERNIEAMRDNLAADQAIVNEKKKLTFTGEPQDAPTPGTPTTGAPGTPAPGTPTTGTPGSMMKEARASRLDASPTPGLDAQDLSQSGAPARESFVQQGAQASREASLAGTFGARAQARAEKSENLEQRQSLFAEMRKAAKEGSYLEREEDFTKQAEGLGVSLDQYDATVGSKLFPRGETAPTTSASAPPVGRALAQKNIAEKGIQGAAADYFTRQREENWRKGLRREAEVVRSDYAANESPILSRTQRKPLNTSSQPDTPMGGLGTAAPTQPTMRPPLAEVGNFLDTWEASEDFGGDVVMNTPPEKGMAYNREAVEKVRGLTRRIDDQMDATVLPVAAGILTLPNRIASLPSKLPGLLQSARDLSERTNTWATEFRNKDKTDEKTSKVDFAAMDELDVAQGLPAGTTRRKRQLK